MIETYTIQQALGTEEEINFVRYTIHFEEDGYRAEHVSEMVLPTPIPANSTESEVITAGLSALGTPTLNSIRQHSAKYISVQKEMSANQVRYFLTAENAKEEKHRQRLSSRLQAMGGGFMFNGHLVASDQDSRSLLLGSSQLAQMAVADGNQAALDSFSASLGQGWRATDDAIVATNAQEILSLMQALAGHVAVCDAISQGHKAAIESATTVAEVIALDVTSGYAA